MNVLAELEEERTKLGLQANGERPAEPRQLTFDVGKAGGSPDYASLKIGGDFALGRDLRRQTRVHIRVFAEDGEIITEGAGTVTAVGFKDKEDKHGNVTTERVHTVTLD